MTDIIKTCKKHGDLTREQVVKKSKNKEGKILYRCKACLKEYHRNHYVKNTEKLLNKTKKFNEENRERYLSRKKIYSQRYRENHREEERARIRDLDRKYRESLDDRYIRKTLTRRTSIKQYEIPQAMVELKKITMLVKRKLKDINKEKLIKNLLEKKNGKDQND
jgi:hypothetical protein